MSTVGIGMRQLLDDARVDQAAIQRERTQNVLALSSPGFVIVFE